MSETKSELGSRVHGLRSQKGSSLNKIKNGQMMPTGEALQKLAVGFAVNVSMNAEGQPHAIL
jgi:hypothetical protein